MLPVLPESDILDSELLGSCGVYESAIFSDESRFRVFSAAEKKIEADEGEVAHGLVVGVC